MSAVAVLKKGEGRSLKAGGMIVTTAPNGAKGAALFAESEEGGFDCVLMDLRMPVMGIPLYQDDVISSGECIDCFKCKDICPRENISANPAPAIAAVAAASAITGFYYVGNLAGSLSTGSSAFATTTETGQGPYTDGTFTGSASGYHAQQVVIFYFISVIAVFRQTVSVLRIEFIVVHLRLNMLMRRERRPFAGIVDDFSDEKVRLRAV